MPDVEYMEPQIQGDTVLLGIETSCDESAVAILRHGKSTGAEVLSSLVSSQIDLHRAYGGVVPEVASRNHALVLRPLVEQSLEEAGLQAHDIDAFAATRGPGLASSLLVGHSMAKALATASNKPFLSINHMEGHLLSPFLENHLSPATHCDSKIPRHLALIVSGGHTMLVHARGMGDYLLMGRTIDDAAGEAFDKVARMLGLSYPGGPEIEKQALSGNPAAYQFPRSMPGDLNFSFSGLKTAVRYTLARIEDHDQEIPDLCASFQQAVIDVLVSKTLHATHESGCNLVTLSGGVSCNHALRSALSGACRENGFDFLACPPHFSTDNAAMIAFAGLLNLQAECLGDLTADLDPNLSLCPEQSG